MRTFKSFPKDSVCPICKTNENKECFLMTIDGTEEGNNAEALPAHVDCLKLDGYRISRPVGIIYRFLAD